MRNQNKHSSGLAKNNDAKIRNTEILREMAQYLVSTARTKGVTQEKLAKLCDVNQSTISKWGTNQGSPPNIVAILGMCAAIGTSFDEVLREMCINNQNDNTDHTDPIIGIYCNAFNITDDFAADSCYDNSIQHIKRLSRFEKKEYIGFYLHQNSKKNIVLNTLLITTHEVDKRGFCPFSMKMNFHYSIQRFATSEKPGVDYAGKIVSPPNTFYTYFYLTGGEPTDRGMWVLYYPPLIDGTYLCGNGVLLSIDRSKHSPSFQRMLLIENTFYDESLKDKVIEMLQKPFPASENQIMNFSESELKRTHNTLFNLINRKSRDDCN